ncbi:MAG: lipopolysaccharide heptosyltransferase II [Omnitrophica WOR_2 bacterium RIFCSPLOWO2_12_FULL_51_8]|nr:MAG: lipopolysaccharide heptosyltransferase II [Omnitrophica WOR_2 bacterium RIFCSPLOWO2_12_FULL_51_8]
MIFNVNWLGDVLFSTAAVRNIRRNFPDSFIACVIPSRCYPVLKGNPHLDEIMIFDEHDRHKSVLPKLSFVRQLKSKKFDTVFLLHRSFSRTLICRLAGITERIGYYTRKRAFLLTKKIHPPKKDSLHRIDYYLKIIDAAGLKVEDRFPEFFIGPADTDFVENFFKKQAVKKGEFVAALNPGGNWCPKRWPPAFWAELADKLINRLNCRVVITGSHSDTKIAEEIMARMKQRPIVSCGAFNLKQLGALIRRADVFVSADSGPLHIASCVGAKKIIALFGPTSVEVTGPYPYKNTIVLQKDVGCKIPCYEVNCKDNRCMQAITPDEVLEKIVT